MSRNPQVAPKTTIAADEASIPLQDSLVITMLSIVPIARTGRKYGKQAQTANCNRTIPAHNDFRSELKTRACRPKYVKTNGTMTWGIEKRKYGKCRSRNPATDGKCLTSAKYVRGDCSTSRLKLAVSVNQSLEWGNREIIQKTAPTNVSAAHKPAHTSIAAVQ